MNRNHTKTIDKYEQEIELYLEIKAYRDEAERKIKAARSNKSKAKYQKIIDDTSDKMASHEQKYQEALNRITQLASKASEAIGVNKLYVRDITQGIEDAKEHLKERIAKEQKRLKRYTDADIENREYHAALKALLLRDKPKEAIVIEDYEVEEEE